MNSFLFCNHGMRTLEAEFMLIFIVHFGSQKSAAYQGCPVSRFLLKLYNQYIYGDHLILRR